MKRVLGFALPFLVGVLAGRFTLDHEAEARGGGAGEVATQNGDVNCDGARDISDAVYLLQWLFGGGPSPCPFDLAVPVCGNGIVEPPEECDDGNFIDGDGCNFRCENESAPVCGNGIVEPPEECDDGNFIDGDGCNSRCENESAPVCGNGIVEPPEECDDGNFIDGDGCNFRCENE